MKFWSVGILCSQLIFQIANAGDVCTSQNEFWNGTRCVTVAAGVGMAGGSGIYSVKKYSEANSIEKNSTIVLLSREQSQSGSGLRNPGQLMSPVTNGDRISISYNLSEKENRQHHIKLMMEKASTARMQAATFGASAMTATKTVTEQTGTDAQGNAIYSTRTEPDYAARSAYALMATNQLSEATDYDRKAEDARRGGAVPVYELKKVVDSRTETARISTEFLREQVEGGGRIVQIDRLPVEKFNLMKSILGSARAGLAGVAVGAGFAIEEIISGQAAKRIQGGGYVPARAGSAQ